MKASSEKSPVPKRNYNINSSTLDKSSTFASKLKHMLLWLFTTRIDGASTTLQTFASTFGIVWRQPRARGDSFLKFIKELFITTIGIDGFNQLTGTLTCADGETVRFNCENLTLKLALASFFGLPSRPETIIKGVPQYSFLQFLRNMIGGWNPLKETFEGYEVDETGKTITHESKDKSSINGLILKIYETYLLSFYQWRWTQKKWFIILSGIIRIPLFLVYNIISWPFKFIRNILKVCSEILLPIVSLIVAIINLKLIDTTRNYFFQIRKLSPKLFYQIPLFVIVGGLSLAMIVTQYGLSLACRMALAFTSPLKSALWAFDSGTQILGDENRGHPFSIFVGVLGFILSMALTITLYTIVSPLALGALVAAVPALMAPITWISQIPFIATALAWFSQLPFVLSMGAAFNTAFGVVGAGLTAAFGPAITALYSLINVVIPQVVLTAGIVFGVIIVPAATFITWGVETLSNLFMQWVEQRPIHAAFEWLTNFGRKKSDGFVKLEESSPEASLIKTEKEATSLLPPLEEEVIPFVPPILTPEEHSSQTRADTPKRPKSAGFPENAKILIYQKTPGGNIVVSKEPVRFVKENNAALEEANNAVRVIGISEFYEPEAARRIWNRAISGTDTSARLPTAEELEASRNGQAVVFAG
jgi:hypothetical protein